MKYRREIDGLRALAVTPVILFHAGFGFFAGGFVGVDVFFVISGYLITSIVLDDMDANRFSLIGFWERRARRILPALVFVVLCCVPFAWVLLLPSDFVDFAQSMVAVATFSSNILFFSENGYFEQSSELKPLLHTWSLAVEEQFYLLYPLFLLFILRRPVVIAVAFCAAIFLSSFAFSVWASYVKPDAAFYLLHSRAWELAVGACASLIYRRRKNEPQLSLRNILSLVGFLAICTPIFVYDHATPFPGGYALPPVVGTMLVLLFATEGTLIKSLLSARPLVGIGLISYSAYLWHQPLFAFYRTIAHSQPASPVVLGLLSVAALVLAYTTYKLVEQPFRRGTGVARHVLPVSAVALSCVFTIGLYSIVSDGFPQRYSKQEQALLAQASYERVFEETNTFSCFIDYGEHYPKLLQNNCVSDASQRPRLIIFGDSEAAHLVTGLRKIFREDYDVMHWTGASCSPVLFVETLQRCRDFFNVFSERFLPTLSQQDILVIGGNWSNRTYGSIDAFTQSMREALVTYSELPAPVIVVGDLPNFGTFAPYHVVREDLVQKDRVSMSPLARSVFGPTNSIIRDLAGSLSLTFVDASRLFCSDESAIECNVYRDGVLYFMDTNHLSVEGSELVGAKIKAQVD